MIVTVGNTKGGVGKTTVAINLAILRAGGGHDVLLVDGDEQGSASLFCSSEPTKSARRAIPPSASTVPRCAPRSASLPRSTRT